MAHFAEIINNIVTRVLVVPDFQEDRGEQYLSKDLNLGGKWVKTSYTGKIRKNFAGIGYTYSQELDAFIAPQPYESWTLDEETCLWQPPNPYPSDGKVYMWNEPSLNWEEVV